MKETRYRLGTTYVGLKEYVEATRQRVDSRSGGGCGEPQLRPQKVKEMLEANAKSR